MTFENDFGYEAKPVKGYGKDFDLLKLQACPLCGAIVVNSDLHDEWHDDMEAQIGATEEVVESVAAAFQSLVQSLRGILR